ncbi:MAG: DUF2147 domain-containing protein [Lewinellaceae bacterium]|nr:DUF2147 domain-containing protein [Lewinellaceae bacterium]
MVLGFFLYAGSIFAQSSPVGVWETIDDETGEPKSHVEIYQKGDLFYGKVVELLPAATTNICNDCPGDKKDKPLVGLEILWDMKPYKDYWSYGRIVDPKDGDVYKCSFWLEDSKTLKVRGYIGVSLIGRNQTWHRVK